MVDAMQFPGPMMPEVVAVRDFQRDTHDTYTLTLQPPASRTGYSFRPGQFNMLYAFGVGEVPISVSSDPAIGPEALQHTIRAVGSVTDALGKLQPGDALGLRGPFGSSWPVDAARHHDVVFVSGGIGLAPLRPAIYHVLRHREDYGRVVLLHGSRTPGDLLYAQEVAAWRRRRDFQVLLAVDRADAPWHSVIGPVTMLFAEADFDPARTIGMMCGPDVMMRYTVYEFEKRGVPHGRLYVSLERNMQCAVGFCGHCQFGPHFICMDGPVFRFDRVEKLFFVREA